MNLTFINFPYFYSVPIIVERRLSQIVICKVSYKEVLAAAETLFIAENEDDVKYIDLLQIRGSIHQKINYKKTGQQKNQTKLRNFWLNCFK